MAWSPDSRQIIFLGHRRNGPQVAIVSVEGSNKEYRVVTDEDISSNFSWHPDGSRILTSKAGKLHAYDLATRKFQLPPGHPTEPPNTGGFWNRSAKQIVFVAAPKPESVPWTP
jgi:WD40 repeat protein